MAFTSSDWIPLWKGLGLEAEEELPSPDSFGDNSLKKRVSFSEPVLSTDESTVRKQKQAWKSWRRKYHKSKSSQSPERSMPIVTEKYPDESLDSFESFEEKAMEYRDENLDDDFWDESDERDSDSKEDEAGPSLWSTLFGFGDDEKDFEDGWTEGGSTNFSDNGTEGASTFFSDAGTSLNSSFSEEVKRSDSHDTLTDDDGEEVKLGEEAAKTLKPATSGTEKDQKQRDGVSRSTYSSQADKEHQEWIAAAARSLITPVKVNQEADKEVDDILRDKQLFDSDSEVLDKPVLDKPAKAQTRKRERRKPGGSSAEEEELEETRMEYQETRWNQVSLGLEL